MTGFASKRQAAWNKFAEPWNGTGLWQEIESALAHQPQPTQESKDLTNKNHPIAYTEHVVIGRNPDHGYWLTEVEAVTNFAWQLEEFLKGAEGKLLFVRRAPKLERHKVFDLDKPVYYMIGRFSLGHLKDKNA